MDSYIYIHESTHSAMDIITYWKWSDNNSKKEWHQELKSLNSTTFQVASFNHICFKKVPIKTTLPESKQRDHTSSVFRACSYYSFFLNNIYLFIHLTAVYKKKKKKKKKKLPNSLSSKQKFNYSWAHNSLV